MTNIGISFSTTDGVETPGIFGSSIQKTHTTAPNRTTHPLLVRSVTAKIP